MPKVSARGLFSCLNSKYPKEVARTGIGFTDTKWFSVLASFTYYNKIPKAISLGDYLLYHTVLEVLAQDSVSLLL